MRALHAEFGFQGTHELAEEVDDVAGDVFVERAHDLRVDERREDDRTLAVALFLFGDLPGDFLNLVHRRHEGHAGLVVAQIGELREDRVGKRLGGDGGAVAHDEDVTGRVRRLVGHGGEEVGPVKVKPAF